MTALGFALLLMGATLVVAEAHVPGGVLGVTGGVALIAGGIIVIATLGGGAALAVPVGAHGHLRPGVQILAPRFREDLCLDAGEVIEAAEGVVTPIDPSR